MPLHEAIAERIAADLAGSDLPLLPSSRALAKHYRVSRTVVLRALHLLETRGLLSVGSRQRAARKSIEEHHPLPTTSSADRLYAAIKTGISLGTYSAGAPLPKVQYFTAQERMSTHSVRAVFARLVREGHAHRAKGKVIVGREPTIAATVAIQSSPVVLVLLDKPSRWEGMVRSSRTYPFCSSFVSEARRCGVRPLRALTLDSAHSSAEGIPKGMEQISRVITELGDRYLGTLIPIDSRYAGDLEDQVRILASFSRPVVWFDRLGEHHELRFPRKGFLRIYHSETANVTAAVRYLQGWSHRCAGYVYSSGDAWAQARLNGIREAASESGADVEIRAAETMQAKWWEDLGAEKIGLLLERLSRCPNAPTGRAIKSLIEARTEIIEELGHFCPDALRGAWFDSIAAMALCQLHAELGAHRHAHDIHTVLGSMQLYDVLREGTVTCLIAPNDRQAVHLHAAWLQRAGLVTPRDISIISFDDDYRDYFFPLTSVSPGFDRAAYQALHFILQDITIGGIREGELVCPATVVDNGSVGAPPEKPVRWE